MTISGTIALAPTAAIDSDTNDPNQVGRASNDSGETAQAVASPISLVGTVNLAGAGAEGPNQAAGDVYDVYKLSLSAGQVVEIEFAEDPSVGDLDLYLYDEAGESVGGSYSARSRFECVTVSTTGTYLVEVEAYAGASIYSMRIGAPGTTSTCANRTTSVASLKANEVLATPAREGAARERAAALGAAAGFETLATLPSTGLQRLRLPEAASQRAAGFRALRAADPRRAGAEGRARAQAAGGATTATATAVPPRHAAQAEALSTLRYVKALTASGAYRNAQPNWVMRSLALTGAFPPDDRLYSYQRWHYELIGLPAAMERINGLAAQPAQRPLVAVIDSGVVLDHPDLAPQLFSNGRSFLDSGATYTATGEDTSPANSDSRFHGTHVSGTVAAATFNGIAGAGVAPMAQILPVRVLGADGSGSSFDILQGIQYAAGLPNDGASLGRAADVINLSLGGDRACGDAEQELFDQVRAAGVIVVAAAGNSGRNDLGVPADVGAPANCNGVIGVSAVDAQRQLTYYSNTGAAIDLAAPGGDASQSSGGSGSPDAVYSTLASFDGNGQRQAAFGGMQGTSMASPHVAGVMALMRYVNPALTPAQVDTLLAEGKLSTAVAGGAASDYGRGIVDARKAVDAALALGDDPAPPAGVVVASPSSIDFGASRTSITLRLQATAATGETVASVTSNATGLTVAPAAVDAAGLGTYTVSVDRAAFSGAGPFFPQLTVTLAPARTFTVAVSVSKGAEGEASGASYGPVYVLVLDGTTTEVTHTVLVQPTEGRYPWSVEGVTSSSVIVVAGSDSNNDGFVCDAGEACGGYPVLDAVGGLERVTLGADRAHLDFQVLPIFSISAQAAQASAGSVDRSRGFSRRLGAPLPLVPLATAGNGRTQ